MLFNSPEYAVLLSAVFLGYWLLARRRALRLLLLVAASYFFYAWWSAYYLGLVLFTSTTDYLVGRQLRRSTTPRGRKAWLATSVVVDLGVLCTFKYFNFFVASLEAGLAQVGLPAPGLHLDVVVPVGISFYTFESLSYIIDIYRGRIEPAQSPLEYFSFISFFPHLVAGPIMRAPGFLPQLRSAPSLTVEAGSRGLFLIAVGLIKKSVIADLLALNLVDRVFDAPARYTSAEVLAGVYGYALQLYCDFSAYSDIAIGSALLLGLQLPRNFDLPYRARSVADFWRRWHISLSTWLRDYLYFSLGGTRAPYRNLLVTMLLAGLWHGAAWTFVAWGLLHGLALVVTRAFHAWRGERASSPLTRALLVLATFHFVCFAWIFFRAPSFGRAWEVLRGLTALTGGTANITGGLWALLAAGFATHLVPRGLVDGTQAAMARLPAVAQAALLVAVVAAVRWLGTTAVVPFIYFQF
jgi:D-alanyl-lipoteichoic acid acyltransferase DltB (MBOAT superfamily)